MWQAAGLILVSQSSDSSAATVDAHRRRTGRGRRWGRPLKIGPKLRIPWSVLRKTSIWSKSSNTRKSVKKSSPRMKGRANDLATKTRTGKTVEPTTNLIVQQPRTGRLAPDAVCRANGGGVNSILLGMEANSWLDMTVTAEPESSCTSTVMGDEGAQSIVVTQVASKRAFGLDEGVTGCATSGVLSATMHGPGRRTRRR